MSMIAEMDAFLSGLLPPLGEDARHDFERPSGVRVKSPGQVVTDTDTRIEKRIVEAIRARWPEHAIVGEECGRHPGASGRHQEVGKSAEPDGRPTWWIDPIDGTMNFVRGIPHFALSVAVVEGGRPVVGHVLDPLHGEHFRARAGGGTWLNGRRIEVSGVDDLSSANLHMQVTQGDAFLERPGFMKRIHELCGKTRKLGAMSLELAYLAAGRSDLLFGGKAEPLFWWDIAAGWLLVEEAGGVVLDLDGGAVGPRTANLVAGGGRLVEAFLKAFNEAVS